MEKELELTQNLKNFELYICSVEDLAYTGKYSISEISNSLLIKSTAVSRTVRKSIELSERRRMGSFFTSEELADHLVESLEFTDNEKICDPTCGAGDLLIAAARRLPIEETLSKTLKSWGKCLMGFDLEENFIRLTCARLVILARILTKDRSTIDRRTASKLLPNIRISDALNEPTISKASIILFNPPFGLVKAPSNWHLGTGKVNAASLFFERIQALLPNGTLICSILPEVLRTGTRYHLWRKHIADSLEAASIQSWGIFDDTTDVHVFLLSAKVCKNPLERISWNPPPSSNRTIDQFFIINVGSVVPHRDEENGPIRKYLHAKGLPRWTTIKNIAEVRQYAGRTFKPPFVVIRRTSRPEDIHRAVGTIISGTDEIAVENHLLVCTPISGKIACCRNLILSLQNHATNRFLNERINCRHLTVTAIRETPIYDT